MWTRSSSQNLVLVHQNATFILYYKGVVSNYRHQNTQGWSHLHRIKIRMLKLNVMIDKQYKSTDQEHYCHGVALSYE